MAAAIPAFLLNHVQRNRMNSRLPCAPRNTGSRRVKRVLAY